MNPIPRLPVFGWQAFGGGPAHMPCLLDLPRLRYTTSGRASILLALEALLLGPGQRVLVPTYHCPTMVAPVAHRGAEPLFYPIDEQGAPQLAWLREQDLAGVRALLVPHYFGLPQPMAGIRRWCDEQGVALIEDCAHAMFGRADARPVGTWGDIAIGSLTKFLPTPEGGCLILNKPHRLPSLTAAPATTQVRAAVDMLEVGSAYGRLTGLNALVGSGLGLVRQLTGRSRRGTGDSANAASHAPERTVGEAAGAELTCNEPLAHRQLTWACRRAATGVPRGRMVASRRRHYDALTQALNGVPGLHPLKPQLPDDCAPYVYPLWLDRPDPGYAELRRLGMPVFRWDRLWPGMPQLPEDHGRLWSHHVIQLACHQDLSVADLSGFVQALLGVYRSA
jgi:hypothetical protein